MKKDKGSIIIFVVVIIGIIGILYASIYIFLGLENKNSQALVLRTKAYYIAESGLERGLAIVKGQPQFETFFPFTLNPAFSQYKEFNKCEVRLTEVQTGVYKIRSEGTCKKTKRILEAVVNRSAEVFSIQSWKEVNN